jgi:uncharacterized membrane protein YbhN (UPF0104 family)
MLAGQDRRTMSAMPVYEEDGLMITKLLTRFALVGAVATLVVGALQLPGVRAQIATMGAALGHLRPTTLLAALALSGIGALLSGVEWWHLVHRLGHKIHYRGALMAYLSAGLAGYVVNSVGPVVGTSLSLRRYGVTPGRSALLTLIANALGFCGILVWAPIGLVLLARIGIDPAVPVVNKLGLGAATALLVGMALIMLFVLHALATTAASRQPWIRRLLGHLPTTGSDQGLCLHTRDLLGLVPWTAASWLSGVGALYLVLAAIDPGAGLSPGLVVGAAALASTLGSLAVIVPEGVGVSEGAFAAILVHATTLPLADCLAASVAMRALDPLTKLSLLGLMTVTGNAAVSRRISLLGAGARGVVLHLSQDALALSTAAGAFRRVTVLRATKVRWLPVAGLGIGLATLARLPHLSALSLLDINL